MLTPSPSFAPAALAAALMSPDETPLKYPFSRKEYYFSASDLVPAIAIRASENYPESDAGIGPLNL